MNRKTKSLTLTPGHLNPNDPTNAENRLFRVERITDSIEFLPGDMLSRSDVKFLCSHREWKVTIKGLMV